MKLSEGLHLLTLWRDPSELHCLQLTSGYVERTNDYIPGAEKGAKWRDLAPSLKEADWHYTALAPAREPQREEQDLEGLKPFDLLQVGEFRTPHPWILDACWAPWQPTASVFVCDDKKKPFIRVRLPDGRATFWANVSLYPWSGAFSFIAHTGAPYRNSVEEMSHWWVRFTATPWRLA
jgi:hypothetical protein